MSTDALNALGDINNDEISGQEAGEVSDPRNILKEDHLRYERIPLPRRSSKRSLLLFRTIGGIHYYIYSAMKNHLAALNTPNDVLPRSLLELLRNRRGLQQCIQRNVRE